MISRIARLRGVSAPLRQTASATVARFACRLPTSSGAPSAAVPARAISFAAPLASARLHSRAGRSLTATSSLFSLPPVSAAGSPARTMFIQVQDTPNPRSLKFIPGREVLPVSEDGSTPAVSFDASTRGLAKTRSPLAYTLLLLDEVTGVMFGSDFVTVTIEEGADWMPLKPQVFAAITDAYGSGEPIVRSAEAGDAAPSLEQPALPGDEETVELIKEIIDVRVRPSVMEDGGDIEFVKFDKDRIVWLHMKGSCSGCPSSGATLKQGIQNMLMHYVPEVEGVEEWVDEVLATVSAEQLAKLEAGLAAKSSAETKAE